MDAKIRACTQKDIGILVETIRRSFQDVALHFSLNQENALRHPSNCTKEWIQKDMERGVIYYIAEQNELKKWYKEIGFVEQESKEFPCLPFNVTFMSYKIDKQ